MILFGFILEMEWRKMEDGRSRERKEGDAVAAAAEGGSGGKGQ